MALPTAGALSASMINVELTRASTATFSMNGADERTLAGRPTGTISFNDFYGKSFIFPGQNDSTFAHVVSLNDSVDTISIQSDGKVVIGGFFTNFVVNRIARMYINGVFDFIGTSTGADASIRTTSLQSDGKVIIGGAFTRFGGTVRNRIARLTTNLLLDTTFNVGTGAGNVVETTSVQSDNKVIIGGNFQSYNGTTINRIARLHANGVLDTTFSVLGGATGLVKTSIIQSDGKVIIGGSFAGYRGVAVNRIARIHPNGVRDTTFNVGTGIVGLNARVETISIQSDGKVIVGGTFTLYRGTARNRIARLHVNGFLDTSFNVGTGTNTTICTTSIQSDGKVIIGGFFTSYSGVTTNRIARLHSNGILDTSFNVGSGANAVVHKSAIQSNGKVIIAGFFTSYRGVSRSRVARINV
jgi:uncharacterized delta-60 repeat protein